MITLLTCKEAAERLRVAETTMWDYTRTGKLPFVEIGNRKFIIENDLDQFILSNRKVETEVVEEAS